MATRLDQLKKRLRTVYCLREASALLSWDQETGMPPGAAGARAEQLSALSEAAHDLFVADETGELLEAAAQEIQDPEGEDAHLVRRARREFQRETRLPRELVSELAEATSRAQGVWARAKGQQDFSLFAPELTRVLDLTRQVAGCHGYEEHPYDALLEGYEPGMRTSRLRPLFQGLRGRLVELVRRVAEAPQLDDAPLRQVFEVSRQREYVQGLAGALGYDFNRGRIDQSEHPFCISMSTRDVRITNAFDEDFLGRSIFGTLHETGHALYEQGSPERFLHGPLEGGCSMGVHESQSRLWENLVGRGRAFWVHHYPGLVATFPQQLSRFSLDDFHRAINRVQPSLVRVEADEVTYNLHIMLRFELELALLEGSLQVREIPEAWNAAMQEYLGLVPPHDGLGCLQDVHWSLGLFGYFPTYTLGNLLAAQLWERIQSDLPGVEEELEAGNLEALRGWLGEKVHSWGARLTPEELIRQATGRDLEPEPFLTYLEKKFGALYRT